MICGTRGTIREDYDRKFKKALKFVSIVPGLFFL